MAISTWDPKENLFVLNETYVWSKYISFSLCDSSIEQVSSENKKIKIRYETFDISDFLKVKRNTNEFVNY